jgi:hypothetical protein
MFCIKFDGPCGDLQRGALTLGASVERFRSSLNYWTVVDYQRQWGTALRSLGERSVSALVVSIEEPAFMNFLDWWVIYCDGETVYFQEQLCFFEEGGEVFDVNDFQRFIRPHRRYSDEGEKISEWAVERKEIERFLDGPDGRALGLR